MDLKDLEGLKTTGIISTICSCGKVCVRATFLACPSRGQSLFGVCISVDDLCLQPLDPQFKMKPTFGHTGLKNLP